MSEANYSQQERQQREYYNRIADSYDRHYAGDEALNYRYKLFAGLLGDLPIENAVVLDAACGGGENTGYFLSRGAKVTGVDISDRQCELYAERFPDCQVHCASILQLPYEDASFDLIVTESLHHFHPFLDDAMIEIARVLKPGGTFLYWEPNARSIIDRCRRIWYALDSQYFEDNEASIDAPRLIRDNDKLFTKTKTVYGGGIGYLLVHNSFHFRMSPKVVRFYAGALNLFEACTSPLIGSWNSCWVAGLLTRK